MDVKKLPTPNLVHTGRIHCRWISCILIPLLGISLISTACATLSGPETGPDSGAVWYDAEIVNSWPHDPEAFTQGLIYLDGYLYESTGRRGESTLRKVDIQTGEVVQKIDLEESYFGEGLTHWKDRLIQLTLHAETGFIYDLRSFEPTGSFTYPGEGWGITQNGEHLILSNGSDTLTFLDPDSFREVQRVSVHENNVPVLRLNELEMVDGNLYANILYLDHIAIIDPESGRLTGRIDLTDLVSTVRELQNVNVLNGIAWDAKNDRLFITGKLWPQLYEIRIVPRTDPENRAER
ncbi:MAG: glutaminyl-peptide cyclotransferase [Balneolaceae bacterium]